MSNYKLIGSIKQLLPMTGIADKGAVKDEQLLIIENAGIITKDDKIYKIGQYSDLEKEAKVLDADCISFSGDFVCLPGFIDAHTHICFGGSRAKDYASRNSGKTYLEIAKEGGGIWDTVTKTRLASEEELTKNIILRAEKLVSYGITTAEVKSGYGLSVEEELKMLRAIKKANESQNFDLVATCLAAHIKPKDFDGTHREYLDYIASELLPIVRNENLAQRADIFIEEEAFDEKMSIEYLEKAADLDFQLTVHADQFSVGGSRVAIEVGAKSADHLEASTDKEIEQLAKSEVIPVALPGASIGLGCDFTPARRLLDAGTSLVIASDWNPGSAPMGDLLAQASILGCYEKLSNAEILSGITFRAAKALDKEQRIGTIEVNKSADLAIFPTDNYQEILYQQGQLKPSVVLKKGEIVHT